METETRSYMLFNGQTMDVEVNPSTTVGDILALFSKMFNVNITNLRYDLGCFPDRVLLSAIPEREYGYEKIHLIA